MADFGNQTGQQLAGKSHKPTGVKAAGNADGNDAPPQSKAVADPSYFEFDPWEEAAQRWISRVTASKVTRVLEATKTALKVQISAGVSEGEGVPEIAKRLQTVYSDFSRRRSMVIARTEVASASNAGSHFSAAQTGLDYKRVWLSSRDDRVRDDHWEMDGQTVGKDEPFTAPDGSQLMFPGDSSLGASAAQTVNCRCSEIYEVSKE
jgi:uncharacterized protein with gpF-like domain